MNLGRRTPGDFRHVERYPLSALIADPQDPLVIPPWGLEKSLGLPWWWKSHNQEPRSSCVGHGESAERAITNRRQRVLTTSQDLTYRYDSNWLYDEALKVDEWPGEGDFGTSLRAGYEVLKARGHRRVQNGKTGPENVAHGVDTYRWGINHNEVRAAIAADLAVAIGVNWYSGFDGPYIWKNERWIRIAPTDVIRGGHCVCLYYASDRREAFRLMNSWGHNYGPVWLSYSDLDRLLSEWGEAVVVTDR